MMDARKRCTTVKSSETKTAAGCPIDILNVHLSFRHGQHVMTSSAVSTLHPNPHPHPPPSESSRCIPTWLDSLLTTTLTAFP